MLAPFRPYLQALTCALLLQTGAFAAPVLYENGTFTGNTSAFSIQNIYTMSNSFTVAGPSAATSLTFASWVSSGYAFTQVNWSISTLASGGGTVLGSGTASVSSVFQHTLPGYSVNLSTISLGSVSLNSAGTYFLTLSQAFANGGTVSWEQNSGPSTAVQTRNGAFYANRNSEYFVLYGAELDGAPELDETRAGVPLTVCFLVLLSLRRSTSHNRQQHQAKQARQRAQPKV